MGAGPCRPTTPSSQRRSTETTPATTRGARAGLPGVEVITAGRNLDLRLRVLQVPARRSPTSWSMPPARRDPSLPLHPERLARAACRSMPWSATSSVDPYLLDVEPRVVRGVEGIPQGSLDQWEFAPGRSCLGSLATRRSQPASDGPSCPATRGQAFGRSRACRCTDRSSRRYSRSSSRPASVGGIDQAGEVPRARAVAGKPARLVRLGGGGGTAAAFPAKPAPTCNSGSSRSVASLLMQQIRRTAR